MKNHGKTAEYLTSLLQMLFGTALTAAAFGLIIVPQGFAAGGVTGFSKIVSSLLGLPLSVTVLIMNLSLLLAGLVFVGRAFAAKTVALSVLFPAMLELFSRFPLTELAADPLLSTVAAGLMLGAGAGTVIKSGASSGGFDVLAVILNRRFKAPVAVVMNVCDCAVILMQAVGKPLLSTAYGIAVIMISGFVVSRVVTMGQGQSQVTIFSEHFEEIRSAILNELDVGMTSYDAETGFRQRRMRVIVSVMPYRKVTEMKKLITEIDPTAFVVVEQIQSVLGRGYTLDRRFRGSAA